KVLVVSDLRHDATFVANALDPETLAAASTENRPFRVDRLSSNRVGDVFRSNRLKDYSCLFLLNVSHLDDDSWTRLHGYVREGGGLVIALGDRVDREHYNAPIAAPIIGASLGQVKVLAGEGTTFAKAEVDHPLFSRFTRELVTDLA